MKRNFIITVNLKKIVDIYIFFFFQIFFVCVDDIFGLSGLILYLCKVINFGRDKIKILQFISFFSFFIKFSTISFQLL